MPGAEGNQALDGGANAAGVDLAKERPQVGVNAVSELVGLAATALAAAAPCAALAVPDWATIGAATAVTADADRNVRRVEPLRR